MSSNDWTEKQVLENICITLTEILFELKHLNSAERTGAVSSVAFEDMTKGDPKVTTKYYVGSTLAKEDVDAALAIHAYAHRRAAELAMAGWADTLATLQAAQAAD